MCLNLERIKDIFNSLNVGVHVVDAKGVTILYNKVCERNRRNLRGLDCWEGYEKTCPVMEFILNQLLWKL